MRYLTAICLVALTLVSCGSDSSNSKKVKSSKIISLLNVDLPSRVGEIPDTMHFGTLRAGEVINGNFTLSNKSKEPLVILDIETACGCTTVNYDTKPMTTGEERVVGFTFDSNGKIGAQILYFKVKLADGTTTRVYFDADVI